MRYDIAQSILQSTMNHWDTTRMSEETLDIQIISEIKYDDYQQYTHGMRYVESLALWLRQFDSKEECDLAYNLIKEKLVYISQEEMRQLITYAFPMKIQKYILEKTKQFCDMNNIYSTEERKELYCFFRRCSLFLGLSDGAHMDFFRRQNKDLSNEQLFLHYDYSKTKAKDMNEELKKDPVVKAVNEKYGNKLIPAFCSCFLIDDFSGSGKSYIRKENGKWHGKIKRFFDHVEQYGFDNRDCEVHIIMYIATEMAVNTIQEQVNIYAKEKNYPEVTVDALQIVEPIEWKNNLSLFELLDKNYNKCLNNKWKTYVDDHFEKGEGVYPFKGFADCSLPLVLDHNTPNNTLPVIWYSWDDKVYALFPRVTRHKEI